MDASVALPSENLSDLEKRIGQAPHHIKAVLYQIKGFMSKRGSQEQVWGAREEDESTFHT